MLECPVTGMMGDVCCKAQSTNPDFCQARNQAASDLELSLSDPLLRDAATNLESDIARTYAGCPHLDEVMEGIRQELARRQAEQNQNPPPPTAI